jgi:ribosomal protein S5
MQHGNVRPGDGKTDEVKTAVKDAGEAVKDAAMHIKDVLKGD